MKSKKTKKIHSLLQKRRTFMPLDAICPVLGKQQISNHALNYFKQLLPVVGLFRIFGRFYIVQHANSKCSENRDDNFDIFYTVE